MHGITAIILALMFLAPGAAAQEDTLTNELCPVMVGSKVDPAYWVDHEGERIYFCCERCRERFIASPETYLANMEAIEAGPAGGDGAYPEWENAAPVERVIRFLGRFHPIAVHFPIAFAFAALLAETLFIFMGENRCRHAGRFLLTLGGLSVIAAVPLGWAAAYKLAVPPAEAPALFWHYRLGTAGGLLLLFAFLVREGYERSGKPGELRTFRILLLLAALVVGAAGYYGGVLVHGADHLSW